MIVGYVRLSRDEDKENYSSIIAQSDLIMNYAKSKGWTISKIFIDDNYSGYTLNRPGFNELLAGLESGKIETVVAKDLSRIGRDNGEVLVLLKKFKTMSKNLILVNEGSKGYDLLNDEDDINLMGIKAWYNEVYVRDISKKIKANLHIKQKKGELVMGTLYGYVKDPMNKSRLCVDESVRPVIETVFRLYLEGLGYKKICDYLDSKGYPTPSMVIKQRLADEGRVFKNRVSKSWQTHNIQRIIQNTLYIGTLTTHKKQNRMIKGRQYRVPIEQQFLFPNHHEAIITLEDFELAQKINSKRKKTGYKSGIKQEYAFSSFIYCGDCGYAATGRIIKKSRKNVKGYECTQYAKYGRNRCTSHFVAEEKLIFLFKVLLRDMGTKYRSELETMEFLKRELGEKDSLEKLRAQFNILNEEIKLLMLQKLKDTQNETNPDFRKIMGQSYYELQQEKNKRMCTLLLRIEDLEKKDENEDTKVNNSALEIFNSLIDSERPGRKAFEQLLDKIVIYKGGRVEFRIVPDIRKLI